MKKRSESIWRYKKELETEGDCYKPSVFWENALKKIEKLYLQKGISNFRNSPINLSFFVPTYGFPGNGLSRSTRNELIKLINKNILTNPNILFILEHFKKRDFSQIEEFFDKRCYGDCCFSFFQQKSG